MCDIIFDIGPGKRFTTKMLKAVPTKAKIDKSSYLFKENNFYTARETINSVSNLQNVRKCLQTMHLTKVQYPASIRNSNLQEKTNPIKKWAKDMNRQFLKEDIHTANKHMKKCSSSLVIKEMQIKTTLRYYLMQVRMEIIKKSGIKRC